MGGPSLSLTDTPSGSLSRTGMEFHPLGGAAITASNRDFTGPASPEFTCHYLQTHHLRYTAHYDHNIFTDLLRDWWCIYLLPWNEIKIRAGMPDGGGCQWALLICHTFCEKTSEQQLCVLKLQRSRLFARMVWNPDIWVEWVDSHERKLIWKCSRQQENGLRKPLHRKAVLPQEAIRANQSLNARGLSTGTSYMRTCWTLHRLSVPCPDGLREATKDWISVSLWHMLFAHLCEEKAVT